MARTESMTSVGASLAPPHGSEIAPRSQWQPDARVLPMPPVSMVHEYRSGRNFFVRECYDKYYGIETDLLQGEREQCVTVTGTPGIGKSVFYAYFLSRYRAEFPDPWILTMVYKREKLTKLTVFNDSAEPQLYTRRVDADLDNTLDAAEAAGKAVLFLCDGAPDVERADGQSVVFTSPNEDWLRGAVKDDCIVFMPIWTLTELQEAAAVLDLRFTNARQTSYATSENEEGPFSDDDLEERYNIFGDVARECFKSTVQAVVRARKNPDEAIDKVSSVDDLVNLFRGKENEVMPWPPCEHSLLHFLMAIASFLVVRRHPKTDAMHLQLWKSCRGLAHSAQLKRSEIAGATTRRISLQNEAQP